VCDSVQQLGFGAAAAATAVLELERRVVSAQWLVLRRAFACVSCLVGPAVVGPAFQVHSSCESSKAADTSLLGSLVFFHLSCRA
jgi:hypothetical protein